LAYLISNEGREKEILNYKTLIDRFGKNTERVLKPWVQDVLVGLIAIICFLCCMLIGRNIYLYREKVLLEAAKIKAERLKIEARAEAEANIIIGESITQELILYKKELNNEQK